MNGSIGEKRRRPNSWQGPADDVRTITGVTPSRDDRRRDPEGVTTADEQAVPRAGGACERSFCRQSL